MGRRIPQAGQARSEFGVATGSGWCVTARVAGVEARGLALGCETGDQVIEVHVAERCDLEVGVAEVMVCGGGAGTDDGVQVGAFGGDTARGGIFERDGFVAAEAEAVQDEFVEVGLGLRRRDVFAAGEEIEAVKEAEAGEVGVAPRVRRVGGEADGQGEGAGGVEEGEDAGEKGLPEHERVFEGAAFELAAEHAAGHRPSDGKGDSAGAEAPLPLSKADFPHIRQVRAPRVQPQNLAGGQGAGGQQAAGSMQRAAEARRQGDTGRRHRSPPQPRGRGHGGHFAGA